MGLAERRISKEFETNSYPALKKALFDAMGFEVPVEVKWEQMQADGMSHLYMECWRKVYFEPLIATMKSICADAMGKDALKSALKSIAVCNSSDNWSASSFGAFDGGVLKIDSAPCTNVDNIADRTEALTKLLESKL